MSHSQIQLQEGSPVTRRGLSVCGEAAGGLHLSSDDGSLVPAPAHSVLWKPSLRGVCHQDTGSQEALSPLQGARLGYSAQQAPPSHGERTSSVLPLQAGRVFVGGRVVRL